MTDLPFGKDDKCRECPLLHERYVGPEGPHDPKICLIGEAPGEQEQKQGRPFVGGAGKVLGMLLRDAGIVREEVYITNVLKCRPPNNNISSPIAVKAMLCCIPRLIEELRTVKATVVVPTGNTPLSALGFSRFKITRIRGAIVPSQIGKIIPTFHPAYIMRQWHEFYTGVQDWRKIKRHSVNGNVPYIDEKFQINPTIIDVEMYAEQLFNRANMGEDINLAIDLETYVGNQLRIPIKTVGMAINKTHAIVVPFITQAGNDYWKTEDEAIRAWTAIGKILEHPSITKVMHNALFDACVLMNHGFTINGKIIDTMIAQYLLYHPSAHSLEYLVSIYADYPPWKLLEGKGDEEFRKYNARDCVVLQMILPQILEEVRDNGVNHLLDILMGTIIPTCRMMLNGIPVSREHAKIAGADVLRQIDDQVSILQAYAGDDFNPNSPKQLAKYLFEDLGLKSGVKTKSGKKSTEEDVIKRLSLRYPDNAFLDTMLDYRKKQKQYSTYIGKLDENIHADNRVRSTFKLHTAVTGRYASSDPNNQNLPNRADPQGVIRGMYRAEPGNVIIAGDYSQMELMIFATLANDMPWLQAFKNGEDVHRNNMIDMIGYYDEKYRTFIKNFVFGLIYGSQGAEIEKVAPKELIAQISIKGMLHNLQSTHPAIFAYRKSIEETIAKVKYITNAFGRRRYYPSKPTNADIRSAVNFPIQSTAADIMHSRTPMLDEALEWPLDKWILQLHDANYVETSERRLDKVALQMKQAMEETVYTPKGYSFDLKVDIEYGPSLSGKEMTEWQAPSNQRIHIV